MKQGKKKSWLKYVLVFGLIFFVCWYERNFLAQAAEKIRKWFPEYMRTAMPDAEAGNTDINDVLETAGSVGADLVKEAIADGDWEENSEETKRKKGSDKPLIDTGAMRQAATWQVRDRT